MTRLLTSVLVANRGEIAIRIMRACRELGIPTVAIYSDADRHSMHVRYATEAYRLGPSPAAESYLNIERVIDLAVRRIRHAISPRLATRTEVRGRVIGGRLTSGTGRSASRRPVR